MFTLGTVNLHIIATSVEEESLSVQIAAEDCAQVILSLYPECFLLRAKLVASKKHCCLKAVLEEFCSRIGGQRSQ